MLIALQELLWKLTKYIMEHKYNIWHIFIFLHCIGKGVHN